MELRSLGGSGRQVSVLGHGTWNIENSGKSRAIAAVRRSLDLGVTHIDTAEMYGSGMAEELVGEAISGRRDEIFLVSKVLPGNASRNGTMAACERSLNRLKTDRLDCYLLHWRGPHPLEDTIAAFEALKKQGKILAWGVSNFDEADLEEAWTMAGPGGLVCNQVLYHLEERAVEHAVLPWCEKHGVASVAYSPLGHGTFPQADTPGGRILQEIADVHNATPRQVALRFLLRASLSFVIPKASSLKHAEENAGAGSLRLAEAELRRIDEAFPRGPRPRELPTL